MRGVIDYARDVEFKGGGAINCACVKSIDMHVALEIETSGENDQ